MFKQARELLSKLNSYRAYNVVRRQGILPLPSVQLLTKRKISPGTKSSENVQAPDDPAPVEEMASQVLTEDPVNGSIDIDDQADTVVEIDFDLLADSDNVLIVLPPAGSTEPSSQLPSQ